MAAMEIALQKEVKLAEGTTHTCLSDIEEGDEWCQEITWITVCDKDAGQLIDVLQSIVGRTSPQRVSVPGLQQYAAVLPVERLEGLVDRIMLMFAGTIHQVVIPTLRYVPAAFMFWESITRTNAFIWRRAVSHGCGVLNLHRNFMIRQAREWAVHGPCYAEFAADTGLGTALSAEGAKRYEARLLRLHVAGFDVEHPPSIPVGDEAPVPLWATAAYCKSRSCTELLEGFGYQMVMPKQWRKAKVVAPEKGVQRPDVQEPVVVKPVVAKPVVSRGAKRGRSVSVGQDQGEKAGPARSARGRGRGRVARDMSGHVITTVPMEIGTARAMVKQITDLKAGIRERDADLDRLRRVRAELEKELASAREDVRRKDNVVAVFEARSREESRALRREREVQYEETKEWQKQREDWRTERRDMLRMYEELHAKHHVLKGQFQVFQELGSRKARKDMK